MNAPKYDMRTNPVYQVNFTKNSNGKTLARTKRRVTFGFGFSNAEALAEGLTGMHCRGEEHEVIVVWSLTSGKRTVMADGQEVHYSQGKRTELQFECSWTMNGNHVVRLVANATPPAFREPGTRSFELFLDGLSFFAMPKIYELGLVSGNELLRRNGRKDQLNYAPTQQNQTVQSYNHGYDVEEEQPQWSAAAYGSQNIKSHTQSTINSTRKQEAEPRRIEAVPMIDFMSDPAPVNLNFAANPAPIAMEFASQAQAVTSPYTAAQPVASHYNTPIVAAPNNVQQFASPFNAPTVAAPYNTQQFASPYNATVDEFAPVVTPVKHSYKDVSRRILSAYGETNPSLPAISNEANTYDNSVVVPSTYSPQGSYHSEGSHSPNAYFAEPTEGDRAQLCSADSPTSIRQLTDLEKAMQNLVNFDDISEPAIGPLKLTMAKDEEKAKTMKKGKSSGLAPVNPAWHVGPQASLADIKAHTAPRAAPPKEVMRTHAFSAAAGQAGMLVVYGQTPTEAPPIQQGFGYYAYGGAFSAR